MATERYSGKIFIGFIIDDLDMAIYLSENGVGGNHGHMVHEMGSIQGVWCLNECPHANHGINGRRYGIILSSL